MDKHIPCQIENNVIFEFTHIERVSVCDKLTLLENIFPVYSYFAGLPGAGVEAGVVVAGAGIAVGSVGIALGSTAFCI